jgi:hypothetical protein
MQYQICHALFCGALTEHDEQFVGNPGLARNAVRPLRPQAGARRQLPFDLRTSKSRYLHLRQRFHGKAEPPLEHRSNGEQIARKQETKYLPAPV